MDFWILTGLGLVIFVIMGLWIYLEAKWEREKEEAILLDQLRDLLRDPRK